MAAWRDDFGLYMSSHLAQKSLTDFEGEAEPEEDDAEMSERPIGRRGWASQSTRGHLPKSARLYLSTWGELLARVGRRLFIAYHLRQTSSSDDVASVYKAVEVPS